VAARRTRAQQGSLPTQAELLKLWAIKEEAVQVPAPVAKVTAPAAKSKTARSVMPKSKTARASSVAKSTRSGPKSGARAAAAVTAKKAGAGR